MKSEKNLTATVGLGGASVIAVDVAVSGDIFLREFEQAMSKRLVRRTPTSTTYVALWTFAVAKSARKAG